ncbi:MAG: glycosyltransferase family 39 protein [Sphingomonadaceae bacterium]|nr:glycosyltransferase family 39 protein [Sphingomonadaceae bacterium]
MENRGIGVVNRLAGSRATWAALFLALAFALKFTSFGDLNRHADESFYFLIGQRMHDGLLPYVDMWDRKPFGLFFIFYLISGISFSVLSYQIVASLFAAATAFVIAIIAARWSSPRGGVIAGIAYLLVIGPFEGNTGQAPDFYMLPIALAGLLLVIEADALGEGRAGWRLWAAMVLCGVAITIKHTALFEAVFFGLFTLWMLLRGGVKKTRVARIALACMALGAFPTLVIAAFYWQAGFWPEFWHAMVLSNFVKAEHSGEGWRLVNILVRAALILPLGVLGLSSRQLDPQPRIFVIGWLVAAAIGMVAMRNFYIHYTVPLVAPLAIATGLLLARHTLWRPFLASLVLYAMLWNTLDWSERRRESNRTMTQIATVIGELDGGGGLLVYDAPPYLYAVTGKAFLSPLVFPHHLNHGIERNVSHIDTDAEIDRVLSRGPGVIVMARFPRNYPVNRYSRQKVLEYVRSTCGETRKITMKEAGKAVPIMIFGRCQAGSLEH